MCNERIHVVDLFCGTGGFSSGFLKSDDRCEIVVAIDINEPSAATMKANHPSCLVYNDDIRTIRPQNVEADLVVLGKGVDIIIGGPPCQGFSSIRPFRGLRKHDDRNTLFEQFAVYVDYFAPKVFVFENVVGLVTHNKGRTLQAIVECFDDIGYDTDWRILNAANYGVPQKRERFIMIGVPRGGAIAFPKPTHSFSGKTIGISDRRRMIVANGGLPKALTVMDAISDLPAVESGQESLEYDKPPQNDYQAARRKGCNKLTLHKATNHPEYMLEIIKHAGDNIHALPDGLVTSGFSSSYSRLRPDEPGATITVKFTNPASSKCIHPYQNRALTPREGARIQSFDDSYIFCGTRTQVTAQIGNAVPPLLGKAIAEAIIPLNFNRRD